MAAYIGPMVAFGLLTAAEGYLPVSLYPPFYAFKALVVTAILLLAGRIRPEIHPSRTVLIPAIVTGVVVFAAWVAIERLAYPHIGTRVAFNPFDAMESPAAAWVFVAVRFYGLVMVVPVMEELFWRSFLLKYLSGTDVASTSVGPFKADALVIMIVLSSVAHPEWLAGAVASVIYARLLVSTRSLFATVVAHAVTNAMLGGYIVWTGEWQLW